MRPVCKLLNVYTKLGNSLPINDCTQFGSRLRGCKCFGGRGGIPPLSKDSCNKHCLLYCLADPPGYCLFSSVSGLCNTRGVYLRVYSAAHEMQLVARVRLQLPHVRLCSGVSSHRQPRQCRGPRGPKRKRRPELQSNPNYVSMPLASSECLPGGGAKIIATPLLF